MKILVNIGAFLFTLLDKLWMWIWLWYLAYVLVKSAPTPWHGQCVYFAFGACLVLSVDVRDYVRDGVTKTVDGIVNELKWQFKLNK